MLLTHEPLRAVAAFVLLLLVATASLKLTTSGGPAVASAAEMARLRHAMVSGRTPAVPVDSIEAANRLLASQTGGLTELPEVPEAHVTACWMRSINDKNVVSVLLKSEGVPVTITVASVGDMRPPRAATVDRDGFTYYVQSTGKLNMVVTERNGRCVCLVAELAVDRLLEIASSLEF